MHTNTNAYESFQSENKMHYISHPNSSQYLEVLKYIQIDIHIKIQILNI